MIGLKLLSIHKHFSTPRTWNRRRQQNRCLKDSEKKAKTIRKGNKWRIEMQVAAIHQQRRGERKAIEANF